MKIICKNKKIENQTKILVKLLNIKNAKKIIVVQEKIANQPGTQGFMTSPEKDVYIINILPGCKNKKKTLAHEMIHVKQFDRGDLEIKRSLFSSKKYWKGVEISPLTPYESLEFEIEAHNKMNKLAKRI